MKSLAVPNHAPTSFPTDRHTMMKNLPHYFTIAMCAVVWVTVVAVRTHSIGDYSGERWFTIGVAAVAMYTMGLTVQRLIHGKEEDHGTDPDTAP